ncbi:GntR family transcriptional regulator [Bacillus sp. B15-48]|uniref:GntR family transcriptional regulator n=1 Tax=Bacillus sp. B15-48 TaxID=1548601 RepID=UPI00193ECA51|nr:GntR family transcriptional regulator [Bacillus sp. B15-48]MBM4761078.1 GntR family transcriptional regulator [Bacillus sp. B15-48]
MMENHLPVSNKLKASRNSLPDMIANHLLKKIFMGEFIQGERLIESEIARELNVSNIPVREAFYILQNTEIIERLPRKGVRVKAMSKKEINDYKDALIEVYQLGVDYSQHKWNEDNLRQLEDYLKEATEKLVEKDVLEYVLKCDQISHYIFVVANNKALLRFYSEIAYITKVYCQIKWEKDKIDYYHSRIEGMVKAIQAGDFEQAKTELVTLTNESLII